MSLEIGTAEVAELLDIHESNVAKLALRVDVTDRRAVREALRQKRLPGRKVSRAWLFRLAHVEKFAAIDRPAGRPKKSAA